MPDIGLDCLRINRHYSNTQNVTKWFDDIDLTIGQSFKDVEEKVKDNEKFFHISLFNEFENSIVVKEGEKEFNRFFLQDYQNEEREMYEKYGCERCGRKLIFEHEKRYGLCFNCDRIMFSKSRARKAFEELSESHTCCPEEFYITDYDSYKKPINYKIIEYIGTNDKRAMSFIKKFIKKKLFNKK